MMIQGSGNLKYELHCISRYIYDCTLTGLTRIICIHPIVSNAKVNIYSSKSSMKNYTRHHPLVTSDVRSSFLWVSGRCGLNQNYDEI